MSEQTLVEAINLNDIICHKLQGIVNKVEIVASGQEDTELYSRLGQVLKHQERVADLLKRIDYES